MRTLCISHWYIRVTPQTTIIKITTMCTMPWTRWVVCLTHSTSECDELWRKVSTEIKMQKRSLGGILIQCDWYPYERGGENIDGHRGKTREVTGRKQPSRNLEETNPGHTSLSTVSLQHWEQINFCCLSCPVCSTLLWQPYKQIHLKCRKCG